MASSRAPRASLARLARLVCTMLVASALACGDDAPKRPLGATCSSDGECESGACGGGVCLDPSADLDGDGVDNAREHELGTNPTSADSDNDGLRDRDELDAALAGLDIDGDGTADVLESAIDDGDDDCLPDQYDPNNAVADSELAALVPVICKRDGVCGAAADALAVVCDASGDKRVARCDYAAVDGYEPDEASCDGRDNDCDGAVDEHAPDLDDDGVADCVDDDRDGDGTPDASDLCPALADDQGDGDGDGAGDACDEPAPPVVMGIDPGSPATDPTPTLMGDAEPGVRVDVFAGAGCTGTALASGATDAGGAFAIEVTTGDNGETRFMLQSTNAADLASACIPSAFPYVHDDRAPDAPELDDVEPPSPSADASPRISGTAEARARVELHAGASCTGAPLGAGVADGTGAFSIVIEVPTNASTDVHAVAIDDAGNRSACVSLTSYVHDGERPDPPAPHPTPFSPASPSTTDANPVLRGCADRGATVDVYTEAGCLGALKASFVANADDDACGAGGAVFFGLVAAKPNTVTTFHGQVRDNSGVLSACVPLGTYEHDDIAPDAPVFTSASPPSPSSLTTPTISGTAEPRAHVTLHGDAGCDAATELGEAMADLDGRFVIVATLEEDAGTAIYARVTDRAGNASECHGLTLYVHDGSIPSAPSAHPDDLFTPPSPSSSDTTPHLRGCAQEDDEVAVYTSDGCAGAPVATFVAAIRDLACPTGFAFSGEVTVAGPTSQTTFRGQTANEAGTRSPCATLGTYRYDSVAPGPPALDAFTPASPSPVATPTIQGTAEPGAHVEVFNGAGCTTGVTIGELTADPAGRWTLVATLEGLEATSRFHALARDDAGNSSACVALGTWTHDATPPREPRMNAAQALASPSSNTAPDLRLCTDDDTTVTVYVDQEDCETNDPDRKAVASLIAGSTVCASQREEQHVGFVVDGSVTFYARAVDDAGNRSDCVELARYEVDDDPPAVPEVLRVRGASWVMFDSNTVDRVDLLVSGRAEPASRVSLVVDGVVKAQVIADAAGRFEGTAAAVSSTTPGDRLLVVRATDTAGNVGPDSAALRVIGDMRLTTRTGISAQSNVTTALSFPDGTQFVNARTDASGVFSRRVFPGMMVSVGFERDIDDVHVERRAETWMDLMPGDDLPIDLTPPDVRGTDIVTLDVTLQSYPGATYYKVQSACGEERGASGTSEPFALQFGDDCAETGDNVPVLATAYGPSATGPSGTLDLVAYIYRPTVRLTSASTGTTFGSWTAASGAGSSLARTTLTVRNDTQLAYFGLMISQNYRVDSGDEFDVSQLFGSGAFGVYFTPGTSTAFTLPFLGEIGPWRRLVAAFTGLPGESGVLSFTYDVEQGIGVPPAAIGERLIGRDLLPTIGPALPVVTAPDPSRPIYAWYALGSLEGCDVGSLAIDGEHDCEGTCSTGESCDEDSDCDDNLCTNRTCDRLVWRMAWRPWDSDTQRQLPVMPSGFGPSNRWSPGAQESLRLRSVSFMDFDFLAGWQETKALGRGAFPFGEDSSLEELLPDEARLRFTTMQDN